MNKLIVKILTGTVILLCLGAAVLAASPIKLFLNGQEIVTEVSPEIVDGKVLAPLDNIAEAFDATFKWDKETNSVHIEANKTEDKEAQVRLLEEALTPIDPLNKVKTWAEGVKNRNGVLQYAVMSPELKEEYYAKFGDSNWSTGVSSSWVESYKVIERHRVDEERYLFEVEFTYIDSTKTTFSTIEYVTIANFDGNWLIASIDKVEVKGKITEITLGENQKEKSIFVQGNTDVSAGYDQANVIIDDQTKIYKGYTDQEFTAGDLEKGAEVEVVLIDGPRLMIYPVSAPAKIIRVFDLQSAKANVYQNDQYGFNFSLPESWEGYQVITEKWEGLALDEGGNSKLVETGSLIKIRHPQWTIENPRQDIPIMVFALAQWNSMQQEKFHIGAAPINPKELGRNSKYVFALPARYNYAFPTGYEEVELILESGALKPLGN